MSMRVNTIIAPTATETSLEEAYRVLTFDGRTDKIWLMALKRPWKMPQEFTLSEIASSLSGDMPTRIVREAIPTPYMTVAEEKLPVHVKAVRDEAWECIEPLIAGIGGRNLCSASDRGSQIAARAQAKNMPLKSLYRMLYRYWIYGMTQNACLPNWPNCGRGKAPRRGRDRSVPLLPDRENPPVSDAQIEQVLPTSAQSPAKAEDASSKRSPPPIQIDRNRIGHPYKAATIAAAGVILDFNAQPEDLKIFRMAIDLFYEKENGVLKAVYSRMVRELYVQRYDTDNGLIVPIPMPALSVPTFRMFEYAVKRDQDELVLQTKRLGALEVAQNLRPLIGRGREDVIGPGDRYQIDATIADIYLVNRLRRDWIIGRPVVYLVVDTFSAMITGVFVGLWGPSWDCARHALMNAFSNKVEYCAKYGIFIPYEDWPCDITCAILGADRQELLTNAAESLRKNLNIHCEIAPPYRPDLKFIETRFRLLNIDSRVHWLPGAVTQRASEKGSRDYRLDAVLDLYQFTRVLIKAILHYNKFHFAPQHRLTHPALARTSFDATPLQTWRWGEENGLGSLRKDDPNILRFTLLPTAPISITGKQIIFKKMHYQSDRSLEEQWAGKARANGRTPGIAAYDLEWPQEIWLRDEATGSYETARLCSIDDLYRNRRLEEVLDLTEFNAVPPATLVDAERASGAVLDAFIEGEVKKAKQLTAMTTEGTSGATKIANICDHRATEAATERARLAAEAYADKKARALRNQDSSTAEPEDDNVIEMLRKARDERTDK